MLELLEKRQNEINSTDLTYSFEEDRVVLHDPLVLGRKMSVLVEEIRANNSRAMEKELRSTKLRIDRTNELLEMFKRG